MKYLESLWPSEDRLNATLGTDAHTLDTSVFLAVHQPMRFRRVEYGKTEKEAPLAVEKDMLDALLAPDPEGRTIIPIAGSSGVGKSHVIRWLEAELGSRDDAQGRHVILVPKSSSLKMVLRLILRDLDGARYDQIRESLERASDSLPGVAAKDLRTRLVSVLKSEASTADDRIRTGSSANRRADERAIFGRNLAALLEDPGLWDGHFYGDEKDPTGVVARLAEHVTHEGSVNRRHQFEPSDFAGLVSVVAVRDLSRAARSVISSLSSNEHQEIAAEVLNGVLDQATQSLLDLGNTPLSEVFLDLRAALLEDGKELVVLVEDFAALSGMQGALLDALIHEGRVGGETKYCAIRSALAYTRGYQPMDRDTVRTRARWEWIIEDEPGEENEILDRTVELVGAYWNAARWGTDALKMQHNTSTDRTWVRSFEPQCDNDDDSRTITAFGRSNAGYPLFPLNDASIRHLAREKCQKNKRLVFNPRLIIDRLVLEIAKRRIHFQKGVFPPNSLGTSTITAPDVLQIINGQPVDQRERALVLVTYWAGLPDSAGEAARLPEEVYEAFRLQPVDFGAPQPERKPTRPKPPGNTADRPESFDEEWKSVLGRWLGGERLVQKYANHLRIWMSEAVLDTLPVDWPGSRPCLDKARLASKFTYLPNAMGATGLEEANAAIVLCSDEVWSNPLQAAPIRLALEAVIRFHGNDATKGTWSYRGAEFHAAHYANFIAGLRRKLLSWFSTQRVAQQKQRGYDLSQLIESRLMASAVLGFGVKGGNHLESAMNVLFREIPTRDSESDLPMRWQKLIDDAHGHASRSREDLIELVAARQGDGPTVLAIDVANLEDPVRMFLRKWAFSEGPDSHNAFAATVKRGILARQEQLRSWRARTTEWLGENYDKQATVDEIKELLTEAKTLLQWRPEEIQQVRRLLKTFGEAAVAERIGDAEVALRETPDGAMLPALAVDYSDVMQSTDNLRAQLERLLSSLKTEIDKTLEADGAALVEATIRQITDELTTMRVVVNRYVEMRSHDDS